MWGMGKWVLLKQGLADAAHESVWATVHPQFTPRKFFWSLATLVCIFLVAA